MKIAVVVHGRFHSFHLARELSKKHDVKLFTNYPKRIPARLGVPTIRIKSLSIHGFLTRAMILLSSVIEMRWADPIMARLFSKWAARHIKDGRYDAVYVFSAVAEEIFMALKDRPTVKLLVRGSSHILTQTRILREESSRVGRPVPGPSEWIQRREVREYELADAVIVLSSFAAESFRSEGVPAQKVRLLLLGAELAQFKPAKEVLEERIKRILSGKKLRVLTTGTLSYRKGVYDFLEITRRCASFIQFRFIGDLAPEVRQTLRSQETAFEIVPRYDEHDLPRVYEWADLFLFTTLEDGFAAVVAQAQAAGLPILSTRNCAAPDLVKEERTGWILPIRDPASFCERLKWCDEHRAELSNMARRVYEDTALRDWSDMAKDFESLVKPLVDARRSGSEINKGEV